MGYYSPVGLNDLFSDDDLLFEHSLIAPMTMIRQARLLLFFSRSVEAAAPDHGISSESFY